MHNVKDKRCNAGEFWRQFHDRLTGLGIESGEAGWLVTWAEGFAKSMKGPLKSRAAGDVLRYLEKIAQNINLKEWQIKQAVQALKLLYQEQLQPAWAGKWQWDKAEAHALALFRRQGDHPANAVPPGSASQVIDQGKSPRSNRR